jgi:hypothetical protein
MPSSFLFWLAGGGVARGYGWVRGLLCLLSSLEEVFFVYYLAGKKSPEYINYLRE